MSDRLHPALAGALFGLTIGVASELIRWLIGDQRSWVEMLWTAWLIPFGAVAALMGVRHQKRHADSKISRPEMGRP